jgi:hypothetical protein
MKIRVTVEGQLLTATLATNPAAQDLRSLLPLNLTMNDLSGREKFSALPRDLCRETKHSDTYAVGDIAYWPPGPDIAIFYRQDGEKIPDPGIIILGRINGSLNAFSKRSAINVTIESEN